MLKLDHVAFQVRHMDTSLRWYTEKLGFTLAHRSVNPNQGEDYAILTQGDFRLELIQDLRHPMPAPQPPQPPYCPHLAFEIDDMAAIITMLKDNDIPLLCGPFELPGEETWLYFTDPDNNVLEFIQWFNKK